MQISKTVLTFIGTVAEYNAVADLFKRTEDDARTIQIATSGQGRATVPAELDEAALIRKVIANPTPAQRALYKTLYEAAEPLSTEELARKMGISGDKLNGVFGWLGRKVRAAAGSRTDRTLTLLLVTEQRDGRWYYELQPALRTILKEDKLIR